MCLPCSLIWSCVCSVVCYHSSGLFTINLEAWNSNSSSTVLEGLVIWVGVCLAHAKPLFVSLETHPKGRMTRLETAWEAPFWGPTNVVPDLAGSAIGGQQTFTAAHKLQFKLSRLLLCSF